MSPDTPWRSGRFDAKAGVKKILFGQVYEDVAIEAAAFAPGARVFCIASAGCTAIALAPQRSVTAVDINPVQLAYAEQRAAGGAPCLGSAERLVGLGRRMISVFGWRRSRLQAFLALDDLAEQLAYWNRFLNTAGFRAATDSLLALRWLRFVYAAPLLAALPPSFGKVLRGRLERCWRTHPNRHNPYARALLLGELPPTITAGGAATIRWECADAAGFLESCDKESFDGFSLSNILDGAPQSYRQRLFAAVRRAAAPGASVVLRSFGEPAAGLAGNQASRDRSMLWGVVDVRTVDKLSG